MRKVIFHFLILAVLIPAAEPPQRQPAKASLSGVVVRAGTRGPAASVRVSLARIEKSLPPGIAAMMEISGIAQDASFEEKEVSIEMLRQTHERMQRSGFNVPTLSADELAIRKIVLNPNGSVAVVNGREAPRSTGADGRFAFENLEPGPYQLFFSGPGYLSTSFGQRRAGGPGEPITLKAGEAKSDIVMQMTETAVIDGRVLTDKGLPVVGMPVKLFRLTYDEWGHRLAYSDWGKRSRTGEDVASVATNDRGEYRIYSLPPGRYLLLAFPAWRPSLPGDTIPSLVDAPYPTTYYPAVTNVGDATVIELKPGTNLSGIDMVLTRAPLHRIRGSSIYPETDQTPGRVRGKMALEQRLDSDRFTLRYSTINPADGTFEFPDVLSGSYHLVSPGEGRGVVTVGDADLDGVLFPPLNEGVSVHVSIPGNASPGVSGSPQVFQIKVELALISERTIPRSFSASWPMMKAAESGGALPIILHVNDWSGLRDELAVVSENGGLSWRLDMYPGQYQVSVTELPAGFYVKEARFGRDDVLNGPLLLSGSDRNPLLEIVIGGNGGTLEGVAVDGRGQRVPGAQVVLVPEQNRERADLFKATFADLDGRFTITGIPPGDYKLGAWEALERNGFFAPERLKQADDQGRLIHIAESSRQTANVIPISAEP